MRCPPARHWWRMVREKFRLPSRWVNPLTAAALAILIAVQVLASDTSWALVVVLGVALGGAVFATAQPYVRKIVQGKMPPGFKARYALSALASQYAGVQFVLWCVDCGIIVPADPILLLLLALLVGYAITSILNQLFSWLKRPDYYSLVSVATFWLRRAAELAGQEKLAELAEVLHRLAKGEAPGAEGGAGLSAHRDPLLPPHPQSPGTARRPLPAPPAGPWGPGGSRAG